MPFEDRQNLTDLKTFTDTVYFNDDVHFYGNIYSLSSIQYAKYLQSRDVAGVQIGSIPYQSVVGNTPETSFINPGTNGYFLKSNGPDTVPSWAEVATPVEAIPSGSTMLFYQAAAPTGWTKQTTHNDKSLRVVSGTGGGNGGSTAFTSVFTSRTPTGSVSVSGSNSGGSIANATVTGSVSGSNTSGSIANATVTGSVSGSNSGGSVSNHTLTTEQIPSHSHTITDPGHAHATYATDDGGRNDNTTAQGGQTYLQGGYNTLSATTGISIQSTGGGSSHGHGFTNPTWSGSLSMNAHSHTFTNPTWSGSVSMNAHSHTFTDSTWSGSASFSGSSMDFAVQYVDVIICTRN